VKELAKKIGGVLREPSGSVMALGPLSFLSGLSLWITIPLILMGLTVISVVVWNLIPFFVAAIVMLITYWIVSHFGMREPWRHVLPVIFGLIALMPAFMGWVHRIASSSVATAAATHAQAVQAQGILESLLAKVASGPFAFAAFAVLIFLAIGLASLVRLGSIGAFVAGFLSLALGIGLALNVVGLSGMGLARLGQNVNLTIEDVGGFPAKITDGGTRVEGNPHDADLDFSISGITFRDEEFLKSEEIPGGYKDYYKQKYSAKAELKVKRDVKLHPGAVEGDIVFKAEHMKAHYRATYVKSKRLKSRNSTRIEVTEEAPTNGQFDLHVYGHPNGAWWGWRKGNAKNKVVLWFKGYETRNKGEKRRKERHSTRKVGGIPLWIWVVGLSAPVPAGLVYVGEEKGWF